MNRMFYVTFNLLHVCKTWSRYHKSSLYLVQHLCHPGDPCKDILQYSAFGGHKPIVKLGGPVSGQSNETSELAGPAGGHRQH